MLTTTDGGSGEPLRAALDTSLQHQLSAMNAVLVLSIVLAQSSSLEQITFLSTTAVPSVANGCRTIGLFHPDAATAYCQRPSGELADQFEEVWPAGGPLHLGDAGWAYAFPLGVGRDDRPLLVIAGDAEPSDEEKFLVSVLAQMCGTAICNVELLNAERSSANALSALNTKLTETVDALNKSMEVHERLNDVAASQEGEAGIAKVLHQLTHRPVRIEDRHGNVRALAGEHPEGGEARAPSSGRPALIQQLRHERRPIYSQGAWWSLAEPRAGVIGVIVMRDPGRGADKTELHALEYATTVLSIEVARLQSMADADLRMRRDIAEELLAGIDEATARARAHALGYDLLRPHRVVVVTPYRKRVVNDAFFQAVSRQVRELDIGSLVVGRSDCVIVLAYNDVDWHRFRTQIDRELVKTTCWLAIGGRYDDPSQISQSYQEARFVLDLVGSSDGMFASPVILFENLGVYRLLSSVSDTAQMERFMRDFLGPLIDYDDQHHTELVPTLAQFFECSGRLDDTADALHVHRSTLKYRLRRIREIGGHDPNDGPTRFNLELATKMWQIVRALAPRAHTS